jgi:hypothetical protein
MVHLEFDTAQLDEDVSRGCDGYESLTEESSRKDFELPMEKHVEEIQIGGTV